MRDLLSILERIAVALEERNADLKRGTLKAEPGTIPERTYVGQGQPKELSDADQPEARTVRRPRQSSRG